MGRSHAIIGDVHGALGPLETLVAKLELSSGDHLIFVGDLVDKGPDPAGVVRFIRHLHETAPFKVTLIEGNHEDKHRRYYANKTKRPKVAKAMAVMSRELRDLDKALCVADRDFLATAIPFLRLPDWKVLIVHGGIPQDLTIFPGTVEQANALKGKARTSFRKILRTRYVSKINGRFLAYGEESPGDPFWAETYDGRFGHVLFGHQPFMEGPACYSHATGLDTACIHGGSLTALVLPERGRPHFESVTGIEVKPFKAEKAPPYPAKKFTLVWPDSSNI
ncbi:MAG: metallophosphoesterase family protein [Pseudomonadota bacterium]